MKLLKPPWVKHESQSGDNPIFSIDIHPDKTRFATGGQGDDCGRVVIWNMAPIQSKKDEDNSNVPKILCQMDNHLACVNCVRWSNSGKYLASCSDDKVIMIWQISRYAGGSSAFGGTMNVEQWRCTFTLRGHSGDILDLSWSPNNMWLASCSVDNTVIVWNAQKFPETVACLRGHTGLVKGVTWDPVGKYLASQSDDKTLRVWRTLDFQEETVVTKPFEECSGTTVILRCSWSPDGQYLVSAHAMNGGGPTAQIVERDGWKTEKDFVGHRKAVTCVKFSDVILQNSNKSSKTQHYTCCAIGSRDCSISVWLTNLRRPLVVVHELFTNSILDISWSCCGQYLMACSSDGTVAYIEFSKEELGVPLSSEEQNALHLKMYGKSRTAVSGHIHSASALVVENPDLLQPSSDSVDKQKVTVEYDGTSQMSRPSPAMKGPTDKQIEMRTIDGRRRITPVFIPPLPEVSDGTPRPFSSTSNSKNQQMFSSSSEPRSKIRIEKRDDIVKPNVSNTPVKQVPREPISMTEDTVTSSQEPAVVKTTASKLEDNLQKKMSEKPKEIPVSTIPVKRKNERELARTTTSKRNKTVHYDRHHSSPLIEDEETEYVRYVHQEKGLNLPPLTATKSAVSQIPTKRKNESTSVEVENSFCSSSHGSIHQLRYIENGSQLWDVMLGSPICSVQTSDRLIVTVCKDCSLHVFDHKGCRKLPPVLLSSPASQISMNEFYLLVLTTRGSIYMWDMRLMKVIVKDESLYPILPSHPENEVSIQNCSVTKSGYPLVMLSTGRAFTYSTDLGTWMLMVNSDDPVCCASDSQATAPSADVTVRGLPLANMRTQVRRMGRSATNVLKSNIEAQRSSTISYLDQQMATASYLQSPQEYKFWLNTLIRYLLQEGSDQRLRDICDDLLGPVHLSATKSKTWKPDIMGLKKRSLLEDILQLMKSDLRYQRLYDEYSTQLEEVKVQFDV